MILIKVKPTLKTMLKFYNQYDLDIYTPDHFLNSQHMLRRNFIEVYNAATQGWRESKRVAVPKVVILSGIPTSGKSTWARRTLKYEGFAFVSRDDIRMKLFGKNYKQNNVDERTVTKEFVESLDQYILERRDIVLDNTHAKEAYLDAAIKTFNNSGYEIYVIFFDISLWKAYLRNIIRKLMTGKWIPVKVIKAMYESYNRINKTKYASYKWFETLT